ncbi:hypothetical protein [Streptomyces sp. NPDC003832]
MTSIERTAYPRFKRLVSAHELYLFFAPTREAGDDVLQARGAEGDGGQAELAELHEKQQAMVEALIGNYRTLLQQVDDDGPAQQGKARAAVLAAKVLAALSEVEVDAGAGEVAAAFGGAVAPALHALAGAVRAQAGRLGAVVDVVEGFGGFTRQYEQIEKVSAHHGNFWRCCTGSCARTGRCVRLHPARVAARHLGRHPGAGCAGARP